MSKQSRKVLLGAATLAAAVMIGGPNANAATDDVQIEARIIAAIAIASNQALDFGTMSMDGPGTGTLTINPDGSNAAPTGDINLIGGTAPGLFTVTAAEDVPFEVTAPASVSITRTDGPETMVINNFRLGTVADAAGAATLTASHTTAPLAVQYAIGGRLNAGAAQAAGIYQGVVTLNAVYQ